MSDPEVDVDAAGGVVLRLTRKGHLEVLVVHRPKYGDWSLPKGKLDAGEKPKQAALREVQEETGIRCWAGSRLPEFRYRDQHGRLKRVRWWRMHPRAGSIGDRPPDGEVDEVRWVRVVDARDLLTYARDADLVEEATR